MKGRTHNQTLASIIGDMIAHIEQGGTLSTAMARHPKIFSELAVNVVKVGDVGGTMEQSLRQMSDFQDNDIRLRSKIKFAMMYPAFAIVASLVVIIVILVRVIPVFAEVYAGNHDKLPWATKFLIALSSLASSWKGVVILIVVIAAVILIRLFTLAGPGRRVKDYIRLKFSIPFIGRVGTKTAISRSAGTFAILLRSGIQVLDGLRIVGKTAGNVLIEEAYARAAERVEQGQNLATVLAESGHFPPLIIDMIGIGDEAGALDVVLEKIAANYQEEVDIGLEAMNRVIEPFMIVVIGFVVVFIAYAVYKPYLTLGTVIRD
jgi:type IV pilus assembly protein PilC